MLNVECLKNDEVRMSKDAAWNRFGFRASSFGLPWTFVIRHSCFHDPRLRRRGRFHRGDGPAAALFPVAQELLARPARDALGRIAVENVRFAMVEADEVDHVRSVLNDDRRPAPRADRPFEKG